MTMRAQATATVIRHRWDDILAEKLKGGLTRKVVTGEQVMIAHVYFTKGDDVPRHHHENEQVNYILSGALKFWFGANDEQELVVRAGEVIVPAETSSTPSRGPGRPHSPELAALRFLTNRERQALRLIAEGESTKEIAQSMHVAYSTARTHVQNVLTKLGVRSRLQAAALLARASGTDQLDNRRAPDAVRSDNLRSRPPATGGGAGTR